MTMHSVMTMHRVKRAKVAKITLIVSLLGLLGACVSTRPRVDSAIAQANQIQRDQSVEAQTSFHLRGRIAIKNARDGGSGRFDWQQDGDQINFELSAPLSNQTWRLEGGPGRYTLTDSKGAPQHSDDARALIYAASGWTIPMQELRFWVRGARAEASNMTSNDITHAPELSFDATGRLKLLKQNGWTVHYERYGDASNSALPIKLRAFKDDAQVKVIVQSWE